MRTTRAWRTTRPKTGRAGNTVAPMPLIQRYREIEYVALAMLEAGRAGDWARVGGLETEIRRLADGVARAGGPDALDGEQRRERLRILRRLVVLDGDLRRLADPMNRWVDSMFAAGVRDGTPHRPA